MLFVVNSLPASKVCLHCCFRLALPLTLLFFFLAHTSPSVSVSVEGMGFSDLEVVSGQENFVFVQHSYTINRDFYLLTHHEISVGEQ